MPVERDLPVPRKWSNVRLWTSIGTAGRSKDEERQKA